MSCSREFVSAEEFDTIQQALDYIGLNGGTLVIPPGSYVLSSQVTLQPTTLNGIQILAYGAEIVTTGAGSGFRILNAYYFPAQIVVEGLKINHRGNTTATAGFELVFSSHVTFRNCEVEANNTSAAYGAFWFHNGDPADTETGCLWNSIDNCTVRKRSGDDTGNIAYGVKLQGVCNATTIINSSLGNTTTGIYIAPESGQTYISNALLISDVKIETFGTGIHVAGATSAAISGLRVVNCRAEAGTTFLSFTGSTAQPVTPPYMAGNFLSPDVAYISNTNNLYTQSYDTSRNTPNGPEVDYGAVMRIRNVAGTGVTQQLWASASDATIQQWCDNAGLALTSMGLLSGGRMGLFAPNQTLNLRGIEAISATTTEARNLRGTVTLASGTASVSFPIAEPNASYFIALGGSANETFRWSSKTTSGFTVTSSNASSVAVVDWHLIR